MPATAVFKPRIKAELKGAVDACIKISPVGDCAYGSHGPIGDWDVSAVTDMHRMFFNTRVQRRHLEMGRVKRD